MATRLNLKTRVLPGKRIEITDPQLNEGDVVDVELILPETNGAEQTESVRDYLQSLPRKTRTLKEWAEFEREFQAERDSWDR